MRWYWLSLLPRQLQKTETRLGAEISEWIRDPFTGRASAATKGRDAEPLDLPRCLMCKGTRAVNRNALMRAAGASCSGQADANDVP